MKRIRFLVTTVVSLLLLACTDNNDEIEKQVEIQELSVANKIRKREDDGVIPKLNRDDTLAGEDNDKNGIRDDIDKYISEHYPEPQKSEAAIQLAKSFQEALLSDKSDMQKLKEIDIRSMRAVNCAGDLDMIGSVEELESLISNTKIRLLEYLKYSKALDGTVASLPEGDTCE